MVNVVDELFEEIKQDFGSDIAIISLMVHTIMISTKPKKSEMFGKKSFTSRIKKKCKKLFWEVSEENLNLCFEIVEAIPSWRIGREMFGLGGSVSMRMKDLINPIKKINN